MSIQILEHQIKQTNWEGPDTAARLGEAALPMLSVMVQDDDPQVRQLTLACLDAIGGATAIEIGLQHLQDPDAEVVAEAIALLHHHPPRQRDMDLFKIYKVINDPFALEQIPLIVGCLAPEANTQPWIQVMEGQQRTGTADNGLVAGLARMGHPPAREIFVQRLLAAQGRRSREWIDRCAYMEDTWIVRPMVPLLDRYDFALSLNPDDADGYLRTCDLAVEVIAALTQADMGFPVKRIERYTGNELSKVKEVALKY